MTSTFGWLDYSARERRSMLGAVDLFRDKGTVDELGLGVIRDAFADRLFPGTSTLQSRTRYWLFVPWLYLQLESERTPSAKADERARRLQADLVRALVAGGESEGVIGIEARDHVLRPPAPLYWAGLRRHGIRLAPGSMGRYHASLDGFYRTSRIRRSEGDETELVDAGARNWHAGIPKAPEQLLEQTDFQLSAYEAEYLRERFITSAPDSFLAWGLRHQAKLDRALSLVASTSGPTVGFGRLLEDHEPPAEPVAPSDEDEAFQALDRIAMAFGALSFQAAATSLDHDQFRLQLVGTGNDHPLSEAAKRDVSVSIRPLSLGRAAAIAPSELSGVLSADWTVSFDGLTAFFVVGLSSTTGRKSAETSFLVRAELIGAPEDRLERVLANAIRNRSDLLRLLLFLLGGMEPAFGDLVDVITQDHLPNAGAWDPILGSDALLEPLMRTLSRNPERLNEIDRLVVELTRTPEGRELLPDGWLGLWAAVTAARYDTERHLLYVACTRARDHLLVTSVQPASEFLDDMVPR